MPNRWNVDAFRYCHETSFADPVGKLQPGSAEHLYAGNHLMKQSVRTLAVQMCDPETNREYLKGKPYSHCGELAKLIQDSRLRQMGKELLRLVPKAYDLMWGITKEQLHKDIHAGCTCQKSCLPFGHGGVRGREYLLSPNHQISLTRKNHWM